ncbi:MAG: hypothetical protein K9N47_20995 [Prosthecobacter sp.]|uniref:hypothetical protein n=1 Tax=Prosthecobacter sp. TaxID=1965333 RepID=UPI0026023784|nr:hypothetical protein [Prosthecobacter sp.]MCF7788613.1 hypothetical protein [Prosthecobacter sp.]
MTSELSSLDEVTARLEALRKSNAEALQTLGNHFGAERWARLLQRAERSGMSVEDIADLAGRMISTRKVHHPKNDKAALIGAANGFICAIGMSPTPDDVEAFESALAATAV